MKKIIAIFGVILVASFLFSACGPQKTDVQTTASDSIQNDNACKTEEALHIANDSFYSALNAMFTADLVPMNSIWSHADNVSDMGPFGGSQRGWEAVSAEFKKEAGMKLSGRIVCKDLHLYYTGSDIGYTVCVEEGENMSADGKPILVNHRATNIFHIENGQWRLVHHHTDNAPKLQQPSQVEEELNY